MSLYRITLLTVVALLLSLSPRAEAQSSPAPSPAGKTYRLVVPANPALAATVRFSKDGSYDYKDNYGNYAHGTWSLDKHNTLTVYAIINGQVIPWCYQGFNAFGQNTNNVNNYLIFYSF